MKKALFRLLCAAMAVFLLIPMIPQVRAGSQGISLSQYIRNAEKRHFVESMLSYHIRENESIFAVEICFKSMSYSLVQKDSTSSGTHNYRHCTTFWL